MNKFIPCFDLVTPAEWKEKEKAGYKSTVMEETKANGRLEPLTY